MFSRILTRQPLFALAWLAGLVLVSAPAAGEPRALMLATVWETEDDPQGWWMSEKFDGVRGYWDGRRMYTRGGERVSLPTSFHEALPPFPLDGELWSGRGRFAHTLATVIDTKPGPDWAQVRYLVFDAPAAPGPFERRLAHVEQWLAAHPTPNVRLIAQTRCRGVAHLERLLDAVEAKGGEGVMLRRAGSPYRGGRSPDLRKYKRFDDAEGRVIGYNPGKGKYRGMVGSLQVELANGTRFAVGSGLSDAERGDPPPVGAQITFKHQGWTRHGKPRFPVYWRVRRAP